MKAIKPDIRSRTRRGNLHEWGRGKFRGKANITGFNLDRKVGKINGLPYSFSNSYRGRGYGWLARQIDAEGARLGWNIEIGIPKRLIKRELLDPHYSLTKNAFAHLRLAEEKIPRTRGICGRHGAPLEYLGGAEMGGTKGFYGCDACLDEAMAFQLQLRELWDWITLGIQMPPAMMRRRKYWKRLALRFRAE